ncbi:MAG: FtsQ-type POTRA domain-containing protein [Alphaproteobacteria bacterium]|nr:FtsQ-type POTRA domain-containing protein [Alphaproteobacteria bacterium]
MRPVRAERATRVSRGQAPARERGVKRSKVQPGTARRAKRPGVVARLKERVRSWLAFRRPMFSIGLSLVAFAFVAAFFVSGKAARMVHGATDGWNALVADAGFGISEVHLAGNQRTPPETILAALGFQPGESIFGADLQSARARLMQLDWVADADVQRRYPDAISVRIVEKLPFALWKTQAATYVVERSGKVITADVTPEFAHLPLLAGDAAPQDAADLVDAVAAHRAIAARTKAYQRVSERRWNLILDGNVVVQLPEAGWREQLDTLEKLIVDDGVLERSVAEIDLRSRTHYFFVLKGQQPQQGKPADAGRGREL